MKLAAERAARRLAPGEAAARLEALKPPAALPAQPELKPEARLEAAAAERAAGVVAFKAGDHAQAVVRFEAGVALFTPMPADFLAEGADFNASDVQLGCLLNIAACQLRLEQPLKAIAACDLATALDEKSVKAWFRRGQACLALGQVDAARKDLTRACQLAPSSREIRDELEKCKRVGAPKFI